jgi:hypothetical protein
MEFFAALIDAGWMPTSFLADPSKRQYTDGRGHIDDITTLSISSGRETSLPTLSTTVRIPAFAAASAAFEFHIAPPEKPNPDPDAQKAETRNAKMSLL